ncbi:MAG: glycosyltransferase [Gammaproteobacteria bacterium]|nr:glycosyltransferase [Gammaproteobacteria bacterium]
MRQPDLAIFLATSGHSGVDRIMKKLVPGFAERGLAVDILSIDRHGPYWDDLPPGVRQVPLNVAHVSTCLAALVGYLSRCRPKVMLSDKDKVNRSALIARRLARVPTRIAVRIGTTVSKNLERRGWLARAIQYNSIRWLYPSADAIIVPSHGVAEDLSRIGHLPLRTISVISNPVVDEDLHNQTQAELDHAWFAPGEPPVILGVGELCARKDFATLLRAFAHLRGQRPCRLIILGEGRQRDKLLKLAEELGVAQDVELPGFVANPFRYMAQASVFALSSTCEGSAVVMVEALATGLPVVSTDCPSGPRETLQQGRFGELVPVGDVPAMSAALQRTLENPQSPELLREAARPFTVAASVQRYLEVLGLAG